MTNTIKTLIIAAGVAAYAGAAFAQTFHVGDRVRVGSTGEEGTIVSVGGTMINGGTQLTVHLDRLGAAYPNVGVPYDSVSARVTVTGPAGGNPGGGGGGAAPAPAPRPTPAPAPAPVINPAPVVNPAPRPTPTPNLPASNDFQVGDHVRIGNTGQTGVVTQVGNKMVNGGTQLMIHLDNTALPPTVSNLYDSVTSRVTLISHGAPLVGASPANPTVPGGPANTNQGAAGQCQAAIRGGEPHRGDGTTVNFQTFQMGAQAPYLSKYKDGADVGVTVRAYPVSTTFSVLIHYNDPNAFDQLYQYTATFECYQGAQGQGYVAESVTRNSTPVQYIHKT